MTFGQCLKQLMEDRDITQRQISKDLNIAVSTLNGYVNDYREPDFQTLTMFARYFQVSTDYLLGMSTTSRSSALSLDHDSQRLIYCFQLLSPELRSLLLDQAKLLLKYNVSSKPPSDDAENPLPL